MFGAFFGGSSFSHLLCDYRTRTRPWDFPRKVNHAFGETDSSCQPRARTIGRRQRLSTSDGQYFVSTGRTAYPSLLAKSGAGADPVIADWHKDFRRSVVGAIHGKPPESPAQQIRWCEALGELPIQEASSALRGYLQSSNAQVREAAKNGLANWAKLSRLLSPPTTPAKPKP